MLISIILLFVHAALSATACFMFVSFVFGFVISFINTIYDFVCQPWLGSPNFEPFAFAVLLVCITSGVNPTHNKVHMWTLDVIFGPWMVPVWHDWLRGHHCTAMFVFHLLACADSIQCRHAKRLQFLPHFCHACNIWKTLMKPSLAISVSQLSRPWQAQEKRLRRRPNVVAQRLAQHLCQ